MAKEDCEKLTEDQCPVAPSGPMRPASHRAPWMQKNAIAAGRFAGQACYTKCLRMCWGSCYEQSNPDGAAAEAKYRETMAKQHAAMVEKLQQQKMELEHDVTAAADAGDGNVDMFESALQEANRQIEEVSENMARAGEAAAGSDE